MATPSTIERFHTNVLDLCNLIQEIVTDINQRGYNTGGVTPGLIGLVNGMLMTLDKETIINNFIEKSYPHWGQIKNRNMEFFEKNAALIFSGVPMDNINAFKIFYSLKDKNGNPVVSDEDREAIWDYFDSLVKISIKYIHAQRKPTVKKVNDKKVESYLKEDFFPQVDLKTQYKIWGVTLEFSA